VQRHAYRYNLVILVVLRKFCRVIALITVNNKHIVGIYSARLCMPVKVL
jgi:hypothetical protein